MLYLAIGVVVLVGGYFVFTGNKKDLPRSQDYPQGFAHADQTAPAVADAAK